MRNAAEFNYPDLGTILRKETYIHNKIKNTKFYKSDMMFG
jgi:hypothetical protein